jgi:hypothetical protein
MPLNRNRTYNRILIVLAGLSVPAGTFMAAHFDQPVWLALSAVGLFFFMMG